MVWVKKVKKSFGKKKKKKKKESKEKDNPLHQLVVNIKRGINGITDYRVKTVQLHLLVIQNK